MRVVALGGSTRPDSASERALRLCGAAAASLGADVTYFAGRDLMLPIYDHTTDDREPAALEFIEAVRNADGVIVASPGYHGAVSGLVKNALDYLEDLRDDPRPYLDGRPIGTIAVAHGWQSAVSTLGQLRLIAHALRGWPTPYGAAVNDREVVLGPDAPSTDAGIVTQLGLVATQVVTFSTTGRG